ncbi:hypothetical protein AB0O07_33870 [Streptomyces sp. NPDC093085]|uniref:hypothetical protein n=1 Tax=Streptomyces sp. NPDC093085 TaxID=3155068 RepID=UPI0034285596
MPPPQPSPTPPPVPSPRTGAPRRDRREPGEIFGPGFSLFADMLLVAVVTTLACLPVVTLPAAFAAASVTLRESAVDGTTASVRTYATRLRAHLTPRTLAGGLLPPLLLAALLADAALVRDGALPGVAVVGPALALLALGTVTVALRAAALEAPYRLSVRESFLRSVADPRGTALLGCAAALALVLAWSIPLLVPLLPGPLVFAATAVEIRATAVTATSR